MKKRLFLAGIAALASAAVVTVIAELCLVVGDIRCFSYAPGLTCTGYWRCPGCPGSILPIDWPHICTETVYITTNNCPKKPWGFWRENAEGTYDYSYAPYECRVNCPHISHFCGRELHKPYCGPAACSAMEQAAYPAGEKCPSGG